MGASAFAQTTITDRTEGLERVEGFIPFYWDAAGDRVLFEVPELGAEILYYVSTAHGVGSVELGIDRGVNRQMVIRFERAGSRVHVVQQNLTHRAPEGHPELVRNVRESFAASILAALPIEAEEGGRVLVDATPLLIRDGADMAGRLRDRDQGSFRLDRDRSSFYRERTQAFPENTEVEVTLTFASLLSESMAARSVMLDYYGPGILREREPIGGRASPVCGRSDLAEWRKPANL